MSCIFLATCTGNEAECICDEQGHFSLILPVVYANLLFVLIILFKIIKFAHTPWPVCSCCLASVQAGFAVKSYMEVHNIFLCFYVWERINMACDTSLLKKVKVFSAFSMLNMVKFEPLDWHREQIQ